MVKKKGDIINEEMLRGNDAGAIAATSQGGLTLLTESVV